MLTTAPVDCLIRGRNCMNTSGSGVGRPSFGSRAWRCRIAAPASAAAIASRAISSGVSGRWGLIVGVWIDPVTAQVMTTLPRSGILFLPPADGHDYAIMTEFGPEVVRLFAGEVHSSRSGIASSADSAGTEAPKAAPPEALRMETARPYRSRQTMVTGSPWKIARTAISANL